MFTDTEELVQDAGRLIEPSEILRPRTLESAHQRQWYESLHRVIFVNAMVVMVALSAISVAFSLIRQDMTRRGEQWDAPGLSLNPANAIANTPWQYADAYGLRSEYIRNALLPETTTIRAAVTDPASVTRDDSDN